MNSLLWHLYSARKPFQWICSFRIFYFSVLEFLFFILFTLFWYFLSLHSLWEYLPLHQCFPNFRVYQNHLETAGPHPKVRDSVDLSRGQRFCIFNKLPGDAEAAGLRTTLGGQFFPLLGLVLTAALKYLPAHTNIWVTLGFVSVVYLFHWEWVRFSYFFMCWPTSDWILDILNVMSWKLWVMLYSSPKCWFFCLRKQLTWSDSVSWEAT